MTDKTVLATDEHPQTSLLVGMARKVLKNEAAKIAWPILLALVERVVRLTVGNDFLDKEYKLVKRENRDLYRLLATLVAQSGGRLVLSEQIWQRCQADRKILGLITVTGETALRLVDEPLETRSMENVIETYFDGLGTSRSSFLTPIQTHREMAVSGQGEPIFLPIFDVTRFEELPE